MFFLPWWVYVFLGTVTFGSALVGQWLANMAQLGVKQEPEDDGPFPCFAHLGTDDDGAEDWCGQLAGDCLGMRQEWPGTEHNDPIPKCTVPDCGRWKGHGGTHY